MNDPLKFKPSSFRYVLETRTQMGNLNEVSKQWCRAFDVGDQEAVGHLTTILVETIEQIAKLSGLLRETNGPTPND